MRWDTKNDKTSKLILNGRIIGFTYIVKPSLRHAWSLGVITPTRDIKTSGVCGTQREAQQKAEAVWQHWLDHFGLTVLLNKPPVPIESDLARLGLLPS